MRKIWGNVQGEKFWYMLRGVEIAETKTTRKTIGHSHVLEPKWRPKELAEKVMHRLLLKAASRLRRMEYYSSQMILSFKTEEGIKLIGRRNFYRTSNNNKLLKEAIKIWKYLNKQKKIRRVKKISVTLYNLQKKTDIHPELFDKIDENNLSKIKRFERLSITMDTINARFGRDSITQGSLPNNIKNFSGTRIAFTRIPDKQEFHE